jgi:hypothetical protein
MSVSAMQLWQAAKAGDTAEVSRLVVARADVRSRDPNRDRNLLEVNVAEKTYHVKGRCVSASLVCAGQGRRHGPHGHGARACAAGRAGQREKQGSPVACDCVGGHRCPTRGLQNAFCDTALMHAVSYGKTATAAELVRLGANINARNSVRVRRSCAHSRAAASSMRRLHAHGSCVRVLRQLVVVRTPLTAGFDAHALLQNGSTRCLNLPHCNSCGACASRCRHQREGQCEHSMQLRSRTAAFWLSHGAVCGSCGGHA